MRIVYMGTPDFAVPAMEALAEAGHEIRYAVTRPDAKRDRGKKIQFSPVKARAVELGIDVLQPEKVKGNREFLETLREAGADVIVVAAYGMILPKELLDLPAGGCLNIHGSLLPRFRGAAPIQAAILAGDEETGITIMRMNEGLDTGDMLMKEATPIGDKTCGQLHDELALMGARLIVKTLETLDSIEPEPQDDAASTYAPMISKEDGRVDFDRAPGEIERQVRAFDPWPGTWTRLDGKVMKIWQAADLKRESGAEPGRVIKADAEGIDVAAGGGTLRILRLQMPGKKRMDAGEYLRGNPIEKGTVLG